MNAIVGFLRFLSEDARAFVLGLIGIALTFSLMLIISSFGYVQIHDVGVWQLIFYLTLVMLAVLWCLWYIGDLRFTPMLIVITIGLVLVSLMGITDIPANPTATPPTLFQPGVMRYIGALVGILFAEGAAFILAIFAWFGVLIGFGGLAVFSTGVDLKDVPEPAWKAFKVGAISAFWLGFTGAAATLATPYVPLWLAGIIWMLILVIIPGACALPSEVPFKVTFYLTITGLLVMLGFVICFVLEGTGVLEKPIALIIRDFWNTVPNFPDWLKWFVALGSFYVAAILIAVSIKKPWISLSAGAVVFFVTLGLFIVWFTDTGYIKLCDLANSGVEFTPKQKLYWIVSAVVGGTIFLRSVLYRRLWWIFLGPTSVFLIALLGHKIVWYGATIAKQVETLKEYTGY